MGIETDGFALHGARNMDQKVSAVVAAYGLSGLVAVHLIAAVLEIFLEIICHGTFLIGNAVDPDHFHESG